MVFRIGNGFLGFWALSVILQNGNATLIDQEFWKHEPRMYLTPESTIREYSLDGKVKVRPIHLAVDYHKMLTFCISYTIFVSSLVLSHS
jgi:hypothetical protein